MENAPRFHIGPLGVLLATLRGFYCDFGYLVELAYVRTGGVCGCEDPYCQEIPHFADVGADFAQRVHLVMKANHALASSDMRVLHRVWGKGRPIPLLRHGGTGYVFVSDPENFPELSPVLGLEKDRWISLPPHRSDDLDGSYSLPAWITPLSVAIDDLPRVRELFELSVFQRIDQLQDLGAEVWAMGGNGIITPPELVDVAVEKVAGDGHTDEVCALVAALCVAGLITMERAYQHLELVQQPPGSDWLGKESLYKSIMGVLFSEGDINTSEIYSLLLDRAISLVDVEIDDDDDLADRSETLGNDDSDDEVEAGDLTMWLNAPAIENLMVIGDGPFDDDADGLGDGVKVRAGIDWVSVVERCQPQISPVSLVGMLLEMSELGLSDDVLTKLALLDMAATALPSQSSDPASLLEYLWPEPESLLSDLRLHLIVVQLFAGLLLRFEMIAQAGMLMREPTLPEQMSAGQGLSAISELIGDPGVVFWLTRHVLNVTTPDLLGKRFRVVASILAIAGNDIIPSVSLSHFLAILGGDIHD